VAEFHEEPKPGVPLWLVSFGDMMTNALTFFILLVSLAQERDAGLIARGLGSFVVALKSHGLPGFLSDSERLAIFDEFRQRFNLPPEPDPERREAHTRASELELIRAAAAGALQPHDELFQPAVATFEPGSAELTAASREYLERLAETLRPGASQLLILEGHARDAGEDFAGDDRWLAFERARAVRELLVGTLDFAAARVEARAWLVEVEPEGQGTRTVDARLVTPARK
jgi:outer membrane protein OmpA-like peptidoglycan-associated protein